MNKVFILIFLSLGFVSCENSPSSRLYDVKCDDEVKSSGLIARLNFCNLSAPSTSAINSCINNTFSKVSSISSSCRLDAASRVIDSNIKLLKYHVESLSKDSQGNVRTQLAPPELKTLIDLLDLYFSQVKQLVSREIYQKGLVSFRPIEDSVFQLIRLIRTASMVKQPQGDMLNRNLGEILGMAATNPQSIFQGAKNFETILPFAVVVLNSMTDPLAFSASIGDLYCDLGRCEGNWTRHQELLNLLSQLNQPEAFDSAYAIRSSERPIDTALTLFINRGADIRSMVDQVASLATVEKSNLTSATVNSRFTTVVDFLNAIQRFTLLQQKFKNRKGVTTTLQFGLDASSATMVQSRLLEIKNAALLARKDFEASTVANYQSTLNEIQLNGQNSNLKKTIESKQLQIGRILGQTLASQADLNILEAERFKYILNYKNLSATALGQDRTFFKFEESENTEVYTHMAPKQETWPRLTTSSVSAMSALPKPVELKAGQMMTIEVSGQWSPVCALKKSYYADTIGDALPKIGPSGYQLALQNGKVHIESAGVTFSTKHEKSNSQTISQGLGIGGTMGLVNVGTGYNGADSTVSAKESGFSASVIDQTSVSETAAFAAGMRLAAAPFSKRFPAGALLVFRIPAKDVRSPENQPIYADDFTHVDQIMVVDPYTTLTANKDSRFYFVVNDCNDTLGEVSVTGDHLTLKKTLYSFLSTADGVKKSLAAMDEAATQLDTDGNAIVKEGGAVLMKLASSISRARAKLQNDQLSDLPAEEQRLLLEFFQSYVDYVGGKIQRKLEIGENLHQIDILNKEIESYKRLIETNDLQLKARNLQMINLANNIQLSYVYSKAQELTDFLRLQAIPLMRVSLPKNYRDFMNGLQSEIVVNDSLDITTALVKLDQLADAIATGLKKDLSAVLSQQRMTIALSFPRPGLDPSATDFPTDVPIAGQDISKALWDMLFKPAVTDSFIRIDPNSIYEPIGKNPYNSLDLACTMSLPVIDNMGIFLYTSSGNISDPIMNRTYNIDLLMGPDLLVPTPMGPQMTSLFDPEWGNNRVRASFVNSMTFNNIEETLVKLESSGRVAGKGLSPFSSYTITKGLNVSFDGGIDSLGYPVDIDSITIAFLVDADKSTKVDANSWLSACARK